MKIVIADDSAIIRAILEQNLNKFEDIEIIDSVSNGRKALDCAKRKLPDVVLLDTDMPEMDGYETAKLLKKEGILVFILAEDHNACIKAAASGASHAEIKPNVDAYNEAFFNSLVNKMRLLSAKNTNKPKNSEVADETLDFDNSYKVLCIGASTGGPTAVGRVLSDLGPNFPLPILYAQHIEIGSDGKMSGWLDETCKNLTVKLARDGEIAKPGCVYMAPADKHLVIEYVKSDGLPVIQLSDDPPVRFLRPAVDKLFFSAANKYKNSCLAILLTGMGRDGADGCKEIVDVGGYTIVEDESTCAVFGMPAAAIEVGGAKEVLPRDKIASRINELVRRKLS